MTKHLRAIFELPSPKPMGSVTAADLGVMRVEQEVDLADYHITGYVCCYDPALSGGAMRDSALISGLLTSKPEFGPIYFLHKAQEISADFAARIVQKHIATESSASFLTGSSTVPRASEAHREALAARHLRRLELVLARKDIQFR